MTKKITLTETKYTTQLAGYLSEKVMEELNLCEKIREVVIYPGAIKHIKNRHSHAFKAYFNKIPMIIEEPDYVGISGKGEKRLEFVKQYKDYVLVALKYNDEGMLFVSSMYIIEPNRVVKREDYGRLTKILYESNSYRKHKQKYKNIKR